MAFKAQGLKEVTKELERIRAKVAPDIEAAVNAATTYGEKLAIDTIFNRYGFRERSYVAQHFSLSFDRRTLQGRIAARMRPSSFTRYASSVHTKTSKHGKPLPAGFSINVMRNQPVWFKGAFQFLGKNGNVLIASRRKGDNSWRNVKGHVKYGPSVGGSFGVIREDIEPTIVAYLLERYQKRNR
ncbi:hypothetical protein L9G74_19060 [Shewanella sp. C32]|uniref:Uncharacterized protein n=1 Tax=Shewanella electrica TaxID=515560 RepID=A0ABT2FSB0_9GAMM|nr:hypothetical protein [Shewanella electrica]MCH1926870.1 hypothetical protein [Shewanella electrica]MCS4558540.1 hypothetical protein [Shewanella electrica]